MKKILLMMLLLTAASAGQVSADDETSVMADLDAALALHKEAQKGDHGWRVTLQLVEKSRQALADGDIDAAAEAASRARKTASESVAQMKREQSSWASRVPGS